MLRIALTLIALAFLLTAPLAESKILVGAYGQADVQRACIAANGYPTGVGGTYGCVKDNCDGKGGQCSVTCVEPTKCLATSPRRLTGDSSLTGVLLNGRLKLLRIPGIGGATSP